MPVVDGTSAARRRPGRLPADPRQHARGRHRAPAAWPDAWVGPTSRRCRCASRSRPTWPRTSRALVTRVSEEPATGGVVGGGGRLMEDRAQLRRPRDLDRARRSPPGRQRPGRADEYRTEPLPDQWELYDLDTDPVEADNRWHDPAVGRGVRAPGGPAGGRAGGQRARAQHRRGPTRRTDPAQRPAGQGRSAPGPGPAQGRCNGSACTPTTPNRSRPTNSPPSTWPAAGRWSVATNHGVLDVGKPTGVFASEMTVPYYAFLDAGMAVDVASPEGRGDPGRPAER